MLKLRNVILCASKCLKQNSGAEISVLPRIPHIFPRPRVLGGTAELLVNLRMGIVRTLDVSSRQQSSYMHPSRGAGGGTQGSLIHPRNCNLLSLLRWDIESRGARWMLVAAQVDS
jgi:hypothetical protein